MQLTDLKGAQDAGAAFVGRARNEAKGLFPYGTAFIADLTDLPRFIDSAFQP